MTTITVTITAAQYWALLSAATHAPHCAALTSAVDALEAQFPAPPIAADVLDDVPTFSPAERLSCGAEQLALCAAPPIRATATYTQRLGTLARDFAAEVLDLSATAVTN